MNPYLPYILPQTRQMPHERKKTRKKKREKKEAGVERGEKIVSLILCVFSIIWTTTLDFSSPVL